VHILTKSLLLVFFFASFLHPGSLKRGLNERSPNQEKADGSDKKFNCKQLRFLFLVSSLYKSRKSWGQLRFIASKAKPKEFDIEAYDKGQRGVNELKTSTEIYNFFKGKDVSFEQALAFAKVAIGSSESSANVTGFIDVIKELNIKIKTIDASYVDASLYKDRMHFWRFTKSLQRAVSVSPNTNSTIYWPKFKIKTQQDLEFVLQNLIEIVGEVEFKPVRMVPVLLGLFKFLALKSSNKQEMFLSRVETLMLTNFLKHKFFGSAVVGFNSPDVPNNLIETIANNVSRIVSISQYRLFIGKQVSEDVAKFLDSDEFSYQEFYKFLAKKHGLRFAVRYYSKIVNLSVVVTFTTLAIYFMHKNKKGKDKITELSVIEIEDEEERDHFRSIYDNIHKDIKDFTKEYIKNSTNELEKALAIELLESTLEYKEEEKPNK